MTCVSTSILRYIDLRTSVRRCILRRCILRRILRCGARVLRQSWMSDTRIAYSLTERGGKTVVKVIQDIYSVSSILAD
jgi:hypothetical protein